MDETGLKWLSFPANMHSINHRCSSALTQIRESIGLATVNFANCHELFEASGTFTTDLFHKRPVGVARPTPKEAGEAASLDHWSVGDPKDPYMFNGVVPKGCFDTQWPNQKANFKGRSDNGMDWVDLQIPCNFNVSNRSTEVMCFSLKWQFNNSTLSLLRSVGK